MSVIGERISTKAFTWIPENRIFVAEVSSIGERRVLGPLYDDACDQGFQLESEWSGNVVPMVLERREHNDGDLTMWIFKPTTEAVRKVPVCAGIEVHLLND
jgi:hypothetical protein